MAAPGKQYGLILPKKLQKRNVCGPKHSAFADDSDEEMSVGETLQKEALKKRVMKQTKLEMQKALEEDSSVYEYDSVYDDMQKKKEDNAAKMLSGKDRKPKYIQNILKAVEHRKKEQEKRMEKKIQKEREMEGEEFQDKEAFVTSAYKKKLQEKAEEEERERREAAIEASLDVTKQKDLSGFYRHLLNQTVGEEIAPECSLRSSEVKQEKPKGYSDEPNIKNHEENIDADSDLQTASSDDEEETSNKTSNGEKIERKTRDICRRSSSSSEDDEYHRHKEKNKKISETGRIESGKSHTQRGYDKEKTEDFEERTRHKEHSRRNDQDYTVRVKEEREDKHKIKDGKREKEHLRREDDDYSTEKDRHGKKDKARIEEKQRDRADKDRGRTDRLDKDHRNKQDRERSERDHAGRDRTDRSYRDRGDRDRADRERADRSDRDRVDRDRVDRSNRDRADRERTDRYDRERADRDHPDRENRGRAERDYIDKQETEHQGKTGGEMEDKSDEVKIHSELEKNEVSSSPSKECETSKNDKGLDSKHKVEDTSKVEETSIEGNSSTNKFAKRSNEETVVSARDRYLARQMARSAVKAYVEKEED